MLVEESIVDRSSCERSETGSFIKLDLASVFIQIDQIYLRSSVSQNRKSYIQISSIFVRSPPASPVFNVPAGSISMIWHTS